MGKSVGRKGVAGSFAEASRLMPLRVTFLLWESTKLPEESVERGPFRSDGMARGRILGDTWRSKPAAVDVRSGWEQLLAVDGMEGGRRLQIPGG